MKKTLNEKTLADILSADVRPWNMSHHPFSKTGRGVLKISRVEYRRFFSLTSPIVPFPTISFSSHNWKEKEANKKTAGYALSELQKPFNSLFLSFSVAPDENSDRQQQNTRRDTKWNVNNFVNDIGIFWCRCWSRGFYDCKENKYIKLWSKVQYQARREWECDGCARPITPPPPTPPRPQGTTEVSSSTGLFTHYCYTNEVGRHTKPSKFWCDDGIQRTP